MHPLTTTTRRGSPSRTTSLLPSCRPSAESWPGSTDTEGAHTSPHSLAPNVSHRLYPLLSFSACLDLWSYCTKSDNLMLFFHPFLSLSVVASRRSPESPSTASLGPSHLSPALPCPAHLHAILIDLLLDVLVRKSAEVAGDVEVTCLSAVRSSGLWTLQARPVLPSSSRSDDDTSLFPLSSPPTENLPAMGSEC